MTYRVSSGYGPRPAPIAGGSTWHVGIDVAAPTGTPVHAAAAGTVTRSEYNSVRGNVVVIDHGGWTTLYQHLHTRDVGRGARVAAGQQIGTIGATGLATGPHLHLEERHGGILRDPAHLVTAVMEGTPMLSYQDIMNALAECLDKSTQAATAIRRIIWTDTKVRRGDRQVSVLQDLADGTTAAQRAEAKADAILAAVRAIPGVDADALAAHVAAAVSRIDAADVIDELRNRLED